MAPAAHAADCAANPNEICVQACASGQTKVTTDTCPANAPGSTLPQDVCCSTANNSAGTGGNTQTTGGGFVPLTNIPGLTDQQPTAGGLASFLNSFYKYLLGLAAILAVIEIIWGGLEISTQDSVSKNKDGKERIQQALFGLVLILSPVLIFTIINPSILNLSLNLPPIKQVAPTTAPTDQLNGALQNTSNDNYNQPTGQLSNCAANGDCLAAQSACLALNNQPGQSSNDFVVCVNSGGQVDTTSSAQMTTSPNSSCPTGQKKELECVFSSGAGS